MKTWEKRFLEYCLQKGLLNKEDADRISNIRENAPEKNVLMLVSVELGWDKKQAKVHMSKARFYKKTSASRRLPPLAVVLGEEEKLEECSEELPDTICEKFHNKMDTESLNPTDEGSDLPDGITAMAHQDENLEQTKYQGVHPEASDKARQLLAPINVPNGEKLGSYILVQKLGTGGMGVVYKAYHPGLEQYFAVKTILSDYASAEQIQRFVREAKIAAKLKHPNIVTVHDVSEFKGQYYIVMDYIQGRDLREIIAAGKLYPRRSLEVVKDIAQALATAHEKGVVHRDIKPSNILISEDDKRPYLMDFGLASVVSKETGITRSGQILGTPQYMSPEQAMGKSRHVDGRSDIYSLGAVLYEMLCGKPVVKGEAAVQMLYHVVYNEPVPLSKQHGYISLDIEAITNKCLEKAPENRYQTAAELAKDIGRYLRGEPVMARPTGWMYRFGKWLKKNKLLASSLGAAGLVLLVSTFLYIVFLKAANEEAQQARKRLEQELALSEKARKDLQAALEARDTAQKNAQEQKGKQEKQDKAQRLIDEALRWSDEKRPLENVENKLKEAQNEAGWYSGLYRAWGKIYYDYSARESSQSQKEMLNKGLEKLKKTTNQAPEDYLAWFYQYLIYDRLGDRSNAQKCIQIVIDLNPRDEYGLFGQGVKFDKEADKTSDPQKKRELQKKAIASYTESISYSSNFLYPYITRGILYKDMNRKEEAMQDYNKSISLDPNYPKNYTNRGLLYVGMNRNEEAMQDYNKAISLDPNSAIAYTNRGVLYKNTNRNEEALRDFSQAIRLDSNSAIFYTNRGIIYKDTNRNEEALRDFSQAIRLDSNSAIFYTNRGLVYRSMNRNEEAMQDFNQAIRLDSRFWEAYANRGLLYYAKGQYREAIADFEYCKKLGISHALIEKHLELCRKAKN